MKTIRQSKEEQNTNDRKELNKIKKRVEKELRDMLHHKDSGVFVDYDPNKRQGVVTLSHPELMDRLQRKSDVSDMISIANSSERVVKVNYSEEYLVLPTFTSLYNGIMPEVSIDVSFR